MKARRGASRRAPGAAGGSGQDMDGQISLMLLVCCSWAAALEPLSRLVRLHRNSYPVYASDVSDEYEPYAVAAVPLQAPVPVLRIVSPQGYVNKYRKPAKRPKPEADLYAYDTSQIEQTYEPYAEQVYAEYEESETQPKYSKVRDPYADEASSVIVYARPNKSGGFTYRRPPAPPAPPLQPEPRPVVIRIHKYRVIH